MTIHEYLFYGMSSFFYCFYKYLELELNLSDEEYEKCVFFNGIKLEEVDLLLEKEYAKPMSALQPVMPHFMKLVFISAAN